MRVDECRREHRDHFLRHGWDRFGPLCQLQGLDKGVGNEKQVAVNHGSTPLSDASSLSS